MWIRTRPASASISLEAHAPTSDLPARTQEVVSFKLLPTNERDHLDLDTGEVFQDYGYAKIHNKESKLISASMSVRAIPDDSYYQHNAMHYFEEATDDLSSHPSSIMFNGFVEPEAFTELADHIKSGLVPETHNSRIRRWPLQDVHHYWRERQKEGARIWLGARWFGCDLA
jgi:hypothetical protein